jgi:hypothetical protein
MFAPNDTVQIHKAGIGSPLMAGGVADSSRSFTNFPSSEEPNLPFDYRLFLGIGQTSGKIGAAGFSVTPLLVLNPDYGSLGSTVSAMGYGFAPLTPSAFTGIRH